MAAEADQMRSAWKRARAPYLAQSIQKRSTGFDLLIGLGMSLLDQASLAH